MFKLLSITAIASAVVLATAASVTPVTPAFAMRLGNGGGGHYHFSHGPAGHRYIGRSVYVGGHYPHHWHHWHHWHHGYGWGVPVAVGVGVAGVAAYEAAPAAAPVCTCLTKQYMDNGAVVFTDTCTNESAIAMPPAGAPK
jgi:hypothetical protein